MTQKTNQTSRKKTQAIETRLRRAEEDLANAEQYVARGVNVEGTTFLHFGDWRGKSGHPSWMKNFMMPSLLKWRGRKEKNLRFIDSKAKEKKLSMRKRQGAIELVAVLLAALCFSSFGYSTAFAAKGNDDPKVKRAIARGLDWVASTQSRIGHWTASDGRYPTAMTALAGMALMGEGSTTTQGKYSKNISLAVDYLMSRCKSNGLIGEPTSDDRYTYGHGFSMLFLSQVLGEEEDAERREKLVDVLTKAVEFTGEAQTPAGGWGYVSSRDGNGFDEGSTTITQVQGLRSCRNAGINVPKEIIDRAIVYIRNCTLPDGAVQYSSKGGGGRPAITAAAIACLFNAGGYDDEFVPKLLDYCDKNLKNISNEGFGHWHYAHYYYAQVLYREGGPAWEEYRDKIYAKLAAEASSDGSWRQGYIGPIYTTATNLTILQMENGCLPIYQR